MSVTRRASPPVGAMTYTCGPSSAPRLPVKAMSLPSGDHFGPAFFPGACVSWTCREPSVARSHSCEELSSFGTSHVTTSTTAHLPSGDTLGGPTRRTAQRSSGVIGRGGAAAAGPPRSRTTTGIARLMHSLS